MKKLILIGGGGHCKSCIDVIESTQAYEILGVLEKNCVENLKILSYPILGDDSLIETYAKQDIEFLITVGQIKSPTVRIKLFENIKNAGGKLATIIASTAYVSKYAEIQEGTIIMHGAFLNAGVKVGQNCIINTKAIIEHDAQVGNNCHISTNAILNGDVFVSDNCFIGSSTVMYQGIKIAENTLIGANSTVGKSIDKGGIYLGNPLRKIK